MTPLQKLASQLATLAEQERNPEDRPDPFELRILAKLLEAQAEIYERGLTDALD